MEWKIIGSKIRGKHNFDQGSKIQDIIVQHVSDDFVCAVATDGAGSALYARKGAKQSADETLKYLKGIGKGIFEFSNEYIRQSLLRRLIDTLKECAQENSCSTQELASTLMFFATDGRRYVAGNLGDGLIGSIDKNNYSEILLVPEKGKFANQSFFITSPQNEEHFHINRGDYNTDKIYFLMTDGTVDCLYNYTTREYAKALYVYCNWARNYDRRTAYNALLDSMRTLFPLKTDDDCALVLIHGKLKDENNINTY
jgi:hypothetical protein